MNWEIKIEKNIDARAVIELWVLIGWGRITDYDLEKTKEALGNTSTLVLATKNDQLIGLARVLSDNVFHAVLAEVVVHPDYQKIGVGRQLVEKVKDEYKHTSIYLDALHDNEKFFERVGFLNRDKMKVYSISSSN